MLLFSSMDTWKSRKIHENSRQSCGEVGGGRT